MWTVCSVLGPADWSCTIVHSGSSLPPLLSRRQYWRLDGTCPWFEFSITDWPLILVMTMPVRMPACSAGLPLVTPSTSSPPQVLSDATHGLMDTPIQLVDLPCSRPGSTSAMCFWVIE